MNQFILTPNRPDILDRCVAFLRALPEDKRWAVKITRAQSQRSIAQNNYWWGVVVAAYSDFSGDTRDDASENLCLKVGIKDVREDKDGNPVVVLRSTTRYGVGEFSDLIDSATALLQVEYGIRIPPPPWAPQ